MSRTQQDQVIDDDDVESCPLCIEEFDLSDRNFRPCPCGYQICQFCYNNIKTTMNGLCPACRRVYSDENIQWKQPSAEEISLHRENAAQQAKKKAAARQKEALKREADALGRKHLAGIRVRQKNLVYVTGMRPTGSPEKLSEELRKPEYFGQYGKIVKVVVSKAKENHVGIYVTFEEKDAAERCIASVDGSSNNENRLRAQYGTTKYCSAYLRGETCGNRSCMFLHEPGEENESFTRQDLSSMNVISTQSPSQANMTSGGHPPQPQPPPQAPQSIAAATQPTDYNSNTDDTSSIEPDDGSALPATAGWAKNAPSRRASQAHSISSPHVMPSQMEPAKPEPVKHTNEKPIQTGKPSAPRNVTSAIASRESQNVKSLVHTIKMALASDDFAFSFDESGLSQQELDDFRALPSLFDLNGGTRIHMASRQVSESRRQEIEHQVKSQALSAIDLDETPGSGSLQLGGEPEERQAMKLDQGRHQNAIQQPQGTVSSPLELTQSPAPSHSAAVNGRGLTTQQQQQLLLHQFKSASPNFLNQGLGTQQQQTQNNAGGHGHARQTSRFSFANDSSASASVKPVANAKLMSQQSSMMPPNASQHNVSQPNGNQFFSSGVQGPPPGLKASGTPPVSGGGMFGQGYGFATAGLSYGVNSMNSRNANEEMMRELLRNRGGSAGSGHTSDAGRREFLFPSSSSSVHMPSSSSPAPTTGISSFPYGPQSGAFQDHGPQKHKRKGKKHRHANTSSSGGGVVDHADPSIMQARMHQTGASGGHGPYGTQGQGQGQGGFNSMMYGNNGFARW